MTVSGYAIGDTKVKAVLPTVKKYALKYGVPIPLVLAVIQKESGFNPKAVSRVGARGLMQLLPKYFSGDLFNVDNNIKQGVAFMVTIRKTIPSSLAWQLAAYNMGPSRAKSYIAAGKAMPSTVKKNYVDPILKYYTGWKREYGTGGSPLASLIALSGLFGLAFWLTREKK